MAGFLGYLQTRLNRNRLGEVLVYSGLISTSDLKRALELQKAERLPLGKILLKHKFLSAFSLRRALFEQATFRILAASVTVLLAFSFFAPKSARAAQIKDIPSQITLAGSFGSAIEPLNYYPNLFGSEEKRSTNLRPFTKWAGMFDRLDAAMKSPANQPILTEWKQELAGFRSASVYAMAQKVNQYVNQYQYVTDEKLWGKSDYWATPIEFFTRGGDCEDYAIAKYASLRALGVPEERLRLAIVHDKQKNVPHAVLIVYSERGAMVLDNQEKTMKAATSTNRYRPIFSINRDAWWLHTQPTTPDLRVASAE
ncbi:MAG: transglutaminase-like cysteine peptidase [Rhodospirillales bacterium]|nr:transglutaminase-like cysteine peptidase [Rhodospirillales bacterium]